MKTEKLHLKNNRKFLSYSVLCNSNSNCPSSLKCLNGFTLLEVMVALLILAIALTAIIKTASDSASSVSALKNKTAAHWVATNTLASIELGLPGFETPFYPNNAEGENISLLNKTWYWSATAYHTDNTAVTRITVQVKPNKESEQIIDTITGYIRSSKS